MHTHKFIQEKETLLEAYIKFRVTSFKQCLQYYDDIVKLRTNICLCIFISILLLTIVRKSASFAKEHPLKHHKSNEKHFVVRLGFKTP